MVHTAQQLAKIFDEDLQMVARQLVQAFGLKHSEEVVHLSDPLLRWMDFTTRYIAQRPRRVVTSSLFPKSLPPDAAGALEKLVQAFIAGEDVNAYQGRGLTDFHDTSGKKREKRTDLLWADWAVHHLHLSPELPSTGQRYSTRSDWLLFCKVLDDEVALIDVRPHGKAEDFADPDLIRQMFIDWPDFMSQFELRGILSEPVLDQTEIHSLRQGGVNGPLVYGGKAYAPPGWGLTSASTPLRLTIFCDKVSGGVKQLATMVADPNAQFEQHLRAHRVLSRDFRLCLTAQGISILEETSLHAFYLPRSRGKEFTWLAELHDLVLPVWAAASLARSS
jgi:hypothetical protein